MSKPGRPPLDSDDPSVAVHLKLPSKLYDALFQSATASREPLTVQEIIRRQLLQSVGPTVEIKKPKIDIG